MIQLAGIVLLLSVLLYEKKSSLKTEKREREFEDYQKEKLTHAKAELGNLLKETKSLTHKTKVMSMTNPLNHHTN